MTPSTTSTTRCRLSSLLAACLALAACHPQRAVSNRPGAAAIAATKAHAAAAAGDLDRADGTAKPSASAAEAPRELELAPETTTQASIVGQGDGCTWVQSTGRIVAGDQYTREQARAAAIAEAQKAALRLFGVEVKSRTLDFQQEGFHDDSQLLESVLQTTRQGRIVDEKVKDLGYQSIGDCRDCRYEVDYKACIVQAKDSDSDFHVEVSLSQNHFIDGDQGSITVTATKDCYVYLYDVDTAGNASIIVPNERVPEVHLKAGDTFTYPDDEMKKSGIELVAQLPQDRNVSAEIIRAVASTTPLPASFQDVSSGGYEGLLRRLYKSPYVWEDDAEDFVIYPRK